MNEQPLLERYNDFTVEGIAEPIFCQNSEWVALSRVLFKYPNNSVLEVVPLWDSISNVERQVRCEMDGTGGSEATRRPHSGRINHFRR
jgi:hypothetical protein